MIPTPDEDETSRLAQPEPYAGDPGKWPCKCGRRIADCPCFASGAAANERNRESVPRQLGEIRMPVGTIVKDGSTADLEVLPATPFSNTTPAGGPEEAGTTSGEAPAIEGSLEGDGPVRGGGTTPQTAAVSLPNASVVQERVAMTIYSHDGGLDDVDHEELHGEPRTPWIALSEHERDDYRLMAAAATEAMSWTAPSSSDAAKVYPGEAETRELEQLRALAVAIDRLIEAQDCSGCRVDQPRPDIAWRDVRRAHQNLLSARKAGES